MTAQPVAELGDVQIQLQLSRLALPGACGKAAFFEEAGIRLSREVAFGFSKRLTVDAASFAKLDVERVGQAVFGQSLRQNANDVVQFHGDGRLYFTPG